MSIVINVLSILNPLCPVAGQRGFRILSTLMTIDTVDGEMHTLVAHFMMEVILLTVTFGTVQTGIIDHDCSLSKLVKFYAVNETDIHTR